MASLKNIKLRIQSYKKTGTVTHAMEAVSAVKMRKSQERALNGRAYAAAALSVLERLSHAVDLAQHSLMKPLPDDRGPISAETPLKSCFIVVTSDKGLAGSLNSSVIRRVEYELSKLTLDKSAVVIIAIGRRGAEYFASRGYDVRERIDTLSDDVSESDIRRITEILIDWHRLEKIASCQIAYTNFISTFEQQAVIRSIVPITPEAMREIISEIRPVRGKYAPTLHEELIKAPAAYTIEPDADTVLSVLLPQLLNIAIFHAVLESKASEHSARRVAMKNATDKAKEMAHIYTRQFNKARQAAITREVSEITSGMEAMK
ncbi:MAG TPA: ATP synthase F1 subunit gamma [Candidatus Paceibacterota bacterium]|nr:ATP synthase F1 subunit gamma [Candidatus Paceibacterota bacterium]